MPAPLFARKTVYLKNNVPYYKYYETSHVSTDSTDEYESSNATIGGQQTFVSANSYKNTLKSDSYQFPSTGAGMATPIITPSTYNNHDMTLSAWIKISEANLKSRTIWGCHADGTVASGISFGIDDGDNPSGRLKFHAKSYGGVLRSSGVLPVNEWIFIVCVYDRTNMEMRIYINGTLDNSQSILNSDAYSLVLGQYIWKAGFWSNSGYNTNTGTQTCSQPFPGNILNACVWYRALTVSEITTLYNSGDGLVIDTTVAPYDDVDIAYPMDEASGNVAYSAISGGPDGKYATSSYVSHAEDSIFAGQGVKPIYLYKSGSNWETDMTVDSNNEFITDVTLDQAIVPTKVTLTFDNTTPRNPQTLTIQGSTNNSSWDTLTTVTIPSNTNQTVEQNITSSTAYTYFRSRTTSAYTTDGLTINNILIDGYYSVTSEVGQHDNWDTQVQEGTHTVIGTSSNYDVIEQQNQEYEVANV